MHMTTQIVPRPIRTQNVRLLEEPKPKSPTFAQWYGAALSALVTSPAGRALSPRSTLTPVVSEAATASARTLTEPREFVMNGRAVRVPLGVTRRLAVSVLKALARVDSSAVVFIRRGNGDMRLEDSDIVEIREAEVPVFSAAVYWTTNS